jgi:hypothetical protein
MRTPACHARGSLETAHHPAPAPPPTFPVCPATTCVAPPRPPAAPASQTALRQMSGCPHYSSVFCVYLINVVYATHSAFQFRYLLCPVPLQTEPNHVY